jgi:putative secretion ATPase (PEP-CTERM system associated)
VGYQLTQFSNLRATLDVYHNQSGLTSNGNLTAARAVALYQYYLSRHLTANASLGLDVITRDPTKTCGPVPAPWACVTPSDPLREWTDVRQFLRLQCPPFQLTPDPAFYFESLTHRKALSYLGYGLAQGEGFIVITGEVGSGKSTLVAHLMATVDRQRLTAAQIVTSKLSGEELVHVAAQAFGLSVPGHDKATALAAIEGFLHAEARAGRRTLLVVDEAQNLSIPALEELRMLSNFQLGSQPLLQVLLLGQPEFRDTLQGHPGLEQLRQRVIAAHHLDAMESAEVEPYILHRLKLVGWNGTPNSTARVFAELHRATGVPRRINQIVNRLLILGAVEQRKRVDGVMLAQVLAELTADGGLHVVSPAAGAPVAAPAPQEAAPVEAAPAMPHPAALHPVLHATAHAFDEALALRDGQIAELQQAVIELANQGDTASLEGAERHQAAIDALGERLATLESRLIEQDRTIRHTLTMLIEWIERDEARRAPEPSTHAGSMSDGGRVALGSPAVRPVNGFRSM